MNVNRIFFIVFGLALTVTAIYVWGQPTWTIPTKRGDKLIHFIGLSKFLFGLAPFLGGLAMFRNSTMPETRKEPLTMTLFCSGIASMILSLLSSQKF